MQGFRVTTIENFDTISKNFRNIRQLGTCIKVENTQIFDKNPETGELDAKSVTICTVIWDSQGAYYPAVSVYSADQLVFVDTLHSAELENLRLLVNQLEGRLSEIEEDLYEEEDGEDESDDFDPQN